MSIRNKEILDQLTVEEKASLCSGKDYWHTKEIPHAGIVSITMCDGPHGIRKRVEGKNKQNQEGGGLSVLGGVPAICYPTAAATACSWDTDLMFKMGQALGDECLKEKVSVLLGPGVNIKRSPLCGRNFEYFSEDPLLAGMLATSFINGVQSKGIGTSMKHYAANNQETRRMTVDTIVDERTLREIYLRPFELAVKNAKPWTVMCAYNRLNGTYCSEHKWLLTDVLRKDWGFEGIVVTDWGAENDRVKGLLTGQELEMPFSGGKNDKLIAEAVKNGQLSEEVLDEAADKLITLANNGKAALCDATYDADEHHELARKIAGQCMVLLKNDNKLLPLKKDSKVLVIGEMAQRPRYQGAGSSLINPIKLDCAYDVMKSRNIDFDFSLGYSTDKKKAKKADEYLSNAVEAAKTAETVVIFAGLTDEYETEGYDRRHIRMPDIHNKLIEEVSKVNKNVVVVLSGGAVMQMPWHDKVPSIIYGSLCGQAGGSAIVDILFGDVNPSGKLAETYPVELEDVPCSKYFPGTTVTSEYRESVFVGYRYYETANKEVRFPFGYGLSYTTFEYSDIKLSADSILDTEAVTVEFKIKNTGDVAGAEVAQVYVTDVESTIFRPSKELKGFKKVFLEPGEEKVVQIELDKAAFAYYNTLISDWHVESGEFEISVGASVQDIKLTSKIQVNSTVEAEIPDYRQTAPSYYSGNVLDVSLEEFEAVYGDKVPANSRDRSIPLDFSNTLEDAIGGKWGTRINNFLGKILDPESMAGGVAVQSPIKTFIFWSMGVFSEDMADGLLLILNEDKFFRGLGKILKGVPKAITKMPALFKSI
ncbi:MAG: glycoside hydrolase family 3 C-terminal domain-containing protein [Oscillospiraceae bacterium]|nr:glycoside hydrolase family 3 C-terminal domain-containing protein [Oscillospiraceae bacterium]